MMQLVTRAGRGSRVAVLVAAAAATATLAAGCAAQAASPAGRGAPAGGGAGTATKIAGSPAPVSAEPVPTTIGGPAVVPGKPACAGWPASAVRGKVPPPSFATAAVLRCAVGFQTIPGKGQWETATLERADRDLAPLLTALHRPTQQRQAGVMCPDFVALAPQFVLVGRDGTAIWPRLPLTGCGQVQSGVLASLSALPWKTVSVRLVARVR
jgi:hypothetical protein